MHRLLTEPPFLLNFDDDGNVMIRDSSCDNGGGRLFFNIKNPNEPDWVTGFEIILTPYVPNQFLGEPQYFEQIKVSPKTKKNRF